MQGRWGAKLWCLEGYISKYIFSLESSADDRFIRCKYSWCFSRKKVLSVPYLALVFLLPVGAHTPLWFSLEQFPPLMLVQFDIRNKTHVPMRHLADGELLLSSTSRWRSSQLSTWAATVLGSFLFWWPFSMRLVSGPLSVWGHDNLCLDHGERPTK